MAGRVSWREMHPCMAAEMGPDFNLEKALQLGMLPVVNESADPEDTLAAYVGLYIREEVQTIGAPKPARKSISLSMENQDSRQLKSRIPPAFSAPTSDR